MKTGIIFYKQIINWKVILYTVTFKYVIITKKWKLVSLSLSLSFFGRNKIYGKNSTKLRAWRVHRTSLTTVLTLGLTTLRLYCPILYDKIKTFKAQTSDLWKRCESETYIWRNFVILKCDPNTINHYYWTLSNLSSLHPSSPHHSSHGWNHVSRGLISQAEFSRTGGRT